MFTKPSDELPPRRLRSMGISWLLHGLLLAWILYSARPRFLTPSSVAYGENGTTITELYWPPSQGAIAASSGTPATADQQTPAQKRITWQQSVKKRKPRKPIVPPSPADADTPAIAANQPIQPLPAGSPYGSIGSNSATGDEVRPALPVSASDPVVSRADLANVNEGDVVIEITIDEKGNIVQKVVLQTLGPAIDAKVLSALENWRFRPATRNGVAIPSKQDVYYHFRPGNG